jgi:hypothetical protein
MHVSPFFSLVASGSRAGADTVDGLLSRPALCRRLSIPPSVERDDSRT